jgi:transposase
MLNTKIQVPVPKKKITIKNKIYVYLTLRSYRTAKGIPASDVVIIGKLDRETGMMIPNNKYYEYFTEDQTATDSDRAINKRSDSLVGIFSLGYSEVLNNLAKEIGLLSIIQESFPEKWAEIMTAAFYMVTEGNIMYFIEEWNGEVKQPYNTVLDSKSCSELFSSISFSERDVFFSKWIKSRMEQEYIAYDVTSISTTSAGIEEAEHGYNRDKENMPQVNIGMYFGESSKLPVYYNLYNGSIVDKEHLIFMLENSRRYNIEKIRFVMDKGFVSSKNLRYMNDNNMPFLIPLPMSRIDAKRLIDENRDSLKLVENRINSYKVYGVRVDYMMEEIPLQAYVYYSSSRYSDEEEKLHGDIEKMEEDLKKLSSPKHLSLKMKEYFDIERIQNPAIISCSKNLKKIQKAQTYLGYFIFLTSKNYAKNPEEIISIYRNRDIVEKAFDDLKNGIDYKRLRTHYSHTTEGKLFVGFLALIIRAWIVSKKKETEIKSLSVGKILYEIKKIRQVVFSDGSRITNPLTKKQKKILECLNISTKLFAI